MPRLDDGTGFQNTDTSLEAAQHISGTGRAAILRKRVMDAYHANVFGMTPDECALVLGVSILSIRPRITELKGDGELVDTGVRRRNASGHRAAVLKVAP